MLQEQLDNLRLPRDLHSEFEDLIRALNAAADDEAIKREGEMQIAFILGLEKAKQLRPADIEALYIMFEAAVQDRLQRPAE